MKFIIKNKPLSGELSITLHPESKRRVKNFFVGIWLSGCAFLISYSYFRTH